MSEACGHPASFTEQVKDALEHIYDLGYLQNLPLARELSARDGALEIAGQHLRRELLAALEALRLSAGSSVHARQARVYNLLDLRYVQMMTLRETALEMNVSQRQVQRDLGHAVDSLAAVLWARRTAPTPDGASAANISSLDAEIARLGGSSASVAIGPLVQQAAQAISPQAALRGVEITFSPPDSSPTVSTERLLAELALINVLSQIVEQAEPGPVTVKIAGTARAPALAFQYTAALDRAGNAPLINLQITQLCERLGWHIAEQDHQLRLFLQFLAKRLGRVQFFAGHHPEAPRGVRILANRAVRDRVHVRLVVPVIGADLVGKQRMLLRQVVRDDEDGFRSVEIGYGRLRIRPASNRVDEAGHVARTVVVDVVGTQTLAREFLKIVVFLVGGVGRADDADFAVARLDLEQPAGDGDQRPCPGNGL